LRKLRTTAQDDVVTGEEYHSRLRKQFKKMHPTPKWVQEARTRTEPEEDEAGLASVIGSAGVRTSAKTLQPGKLRIEKLKDANQDAPANVRPCVRFESVQD
jgi:U3 small nucleolar RNA-associated protein 18